MSRARVASGSACSAAATSADSQRLTINSPSAVLGQRSDHRVAGRLGVELTERLVTLGVLREADGAYAVTASGAVWLGETLGIDTESIRGSRRRFA